MPDSCVTEDKFYSRYDWCLNPILSIGQLLKQFHKELEEYRASEGWEREEHKINLYLFACAIACTADDYFNLRFLNLSALYSHIPRLKSLIRAAEWLLNTAGSLLKIATNWPAWRWRKRWNSCIEQVCDLLITGTELQATESTVPHVCLRQWFLSRKMRLPEAFRGQDFTHQDVITLIQRFCASYGPTDEPLTIVGLRTAGAYFAPLMACYLKRSDWRRVSWFSIRPKNGTSTWETWQLRKLARHNARVLLVDDYPATGATWRLTLQIVRQSKIKPEQISILAPTHAAQPDWVRLAGIGGKISVFTVHPAELYKASLLKPHALESWCAEYFMPRGSPGFHVMCGKGVEELNARMAEHSKDGHHVREKRVFEVEFCEGDGVRSKRKIFLKSVGWGWLGYHAYVAGSRLNGFVPHVIGLRHGLLIMDWIDDDAEERKRTPAGQMVNALASYVAARSCRLRLAGDLRLESRTYRWTGVDDLVAIFRAAYGPYLSRLKSRSLREAMYKYLSAAPTLIDGRMTPEEWLFTPGGIYKGDFEHHNFGGAELDLADPAYDLASAIFEFQLPKASEEQLLETYTHLSEDRTITERLIVYKILYASMMMRYAATRVAAGKRPPENNQLYHDARNFLIYSMSDFCSHLIPRAKAAGWSRSLFFIDVDGVFDQELLGFPHATQSGLQSLMLLQSNGYSVVLNTGRSVEHVRQYCDTYRIPGGIAEFGSVFIDAVQKKEVPLIDTVATQQLAKCREATRALPGVFIDPGYAYSVRAYRYRGQNTAGLAADEIRALLDNPEFSELAFISRTADTYIVQKRVDKGSAVKFVKQYLHNDAPIAAIGHSDYDIPMLKASNYAYALANCSPAVRQFAKEDHCRLQKDRCQGGLLTAVQHRLESDGIRSTEFSRSSPALEDSAGLMQTLLRAADRRTSWQLLADLVSGSL